VAAVSLDAPVPPAGHLAAAGMDPTPAGQIPTQQR